MTGVSDTAALASIGAAARELKLPTIRDQAARLAEIAARDHATYLAYLAEVLAAAMTRAAGSGVLDAQAVIIDARRQAGRQVAPVIPIGALARYDRPAPALDAYDELLARSIP